MLLCSLASLCFSCWTRFVRSSFYCCIRHLAKPIWFVLRHPIHGSRKCIRLNGPISFMDFFWQNGLGEDINFARLQILAKWPRAPYFAGRNVPPSSHATTLGSLWGRLHKIVGFIRKVNNIHQNNQKPRRKISMILVRGQWWIKAHNWLLSKHPLDFNSFG